MIPGYIHGSIAPTFTIFNQDLTFNEDGQRNFLDFLLERGGNSCFFVRAGMGQMYTYSSDDVKAMARTACAHLKGKAHVLVGASGIWDRNYDALPEPETYIAQSIDLGNYALEQGAGGIVLTVPEGIEPKDGQTGGDVVLSYFERMNKSINGPIFIYQPPGTKEEYLVTHDTLSQLADMENVMGVKVSTGDAGYIAMMCHALRGKDFAYISGNECAFLAGLQVGSRAVIGQGATINPKILNAVQDRFNAGDADGALNAQYSANKLVEYDINIVEFFKMYAIEKGCAIEAHARPMHGVAYKSSIGNVSQEQYDSFKKLLETEVALFE